MNKRIIKLLMELIFIFILPIIFIGITSEITIQREFEALNTENLPTNEVKSINFDNSIIKYTDGYKNIINDFNIWNENWESGEFDTITGANNHNNNCIRSIDYISILENTTYYCYAPNGAVWVMFFDNDYNVISLQTRNVISNNVMLVSDTTFTTPNNTSYIKFYCYQGYNQYYNDICINISVPWANGYYIQYGKPLIIYSQTDISGQNDINYTIWGNIKNLLLTNLELNDNVLLDLILCYTILWITMFLLWHLIYGFFELIVHVIPSPFDKG